MSGIVLVTGGAGFIGAAVVDELQAAGRTVRVLDSLRADVHGADAAPAQASRRWSATRPTRAPWRRPSTASTR